MAKTNIGLVEYVKAKIGCYYWFGTFGQMASRSLYNSKKSQYPKYYTATDFTSQINNPKQVFDCSGLIKAYLWTSSIDDTNPKYNSKQDYSATAFYNNASVKGALESGTKLKVGTLVFKGSDKTKSHVGVFVGNNEVVEAKAHAYGVVLSTFSSGGWKYYAETNLITYEEQTAPIQQPVAQPPSDPLAAYTDEQLADRVIRGDFGNGEARKKALGSRYDAVQKIVDQKVNPQLQPVFHTVVKGDTLWAIARKNGTTVQDILKLNSNIKNANMINIGQKIRIK